MDYSGFENRRKLPRIREDLKVRVTIIYSPEDESLTGQQFECHTKDLSFQGMCIFSHIRIWPAIKLEMLVQVDTPPLSFTFTGIVIWCSHNSELNLYETGIQFMVLDEIPIEWKIMVVDQIVKY